jgi:hypothetical protein
VYFDIRPKESLEDLYDFREEFNQLVRYLKDEVSLIIVSGLRRTGKTSLVLTALNSLNLPYVLINGYSFAGDPYISRVDFIRLMESAVNDLLVNRRSLREKLKETLSLDKIAERDVHLVEGGAEES